VLVTQIEANNFFGKCLVGKVQSGSIKVGDAVHALDEDGKKFTTGRVLKLLARQGTQQFTVDTAVAGDIIALAGLPTATVNHTICDPSVEDAIPSIPIDPPTLSMEFSINSSPLAGRVTGSKLTAAQIGDRLIAESENNVSIKVVPKPGGETFDVRGRGDLQLGVLMETMRREGFEFSVSPPQVVLRRCPDTKELLEPIDNVIVDCDEDHSGQVIQGLSGRKAEIMDMSVDDGRCRITLKCPTRGLLGYGSEFVNVTRGTGVLNTSLEAYEPFKGEFDDRLSKPAMISMAAGKVTSYALETLVARGKLFIEPRDETYEGMVVGEVAKDQVMDCNPTKMKQLTNMRASGKEDKVKLPPKTVMSLEESLAYMRDDEQIEVTADHIRLRKQCLDREERKRAKKSTQRKYLVEGEDNSDPFF